MSESIFTYITCASGNNAFTDCLIRQHGDLIRLIGHPQMDFAPADARRLAKTILALLEESAGDPLVDDICDEFQTRSRQGQRKYGQKMTRSDLDLEEWLHHLKAELMDATLYAEAALRIVTRITDDGR